MSFVYPQFLWFLGLLALPILIHLYHFRRHKTLYFSSLQFIKKVDQETRTSKNLKHLLILITRCLAIICAVLAFAQPYWPLVHADTKEGKPALAVYLDNSYSMSQQGTEGELFSEARETARRLIQQAPNNASILLYSNAIDGKENHLITKAEALNRLDELQLSPMVRPMETILAAQQQRLKNLKPTDEPIASAQIVLLSDFQQTNASIEKLQADSTFTYFPIQFLPQNQENLSIDSVWFTNPNIRPNTSVELNIQVTNHGQRDAINTELTLKIGSIQKNLFLDVPAKETISTTFSYNESEQLGRDNQRSCSVQIKDPSVTFDNTLYFEYTLQASCSVLIVNGPDSVPNIRGLFGLEPFFKLSVVPQSSLTLNDIKGKRLIVFNGFNEFPSGTANDIATFMLNGGKTVFFPGSQLNINAWNLASKSLGLPALGSPNSSGLRVNAIAYEDPFFQPVFDEKPQKVSLSIARKAYAVKEKNESIDLISFQNSAPLLSASLERNAFLFTTALTDSFSTLKNSDLFTTTLLRSGELAIAAPPMYLVLGGTMKYPFESNSQAPPHLVNSNLDFIPSVEKIGNQQYISLQNVGDNHQLTAGRYQLETAVDTLSIALNFDRIESSIETIAIEDLVASMKEQGLQQVFAKKIENGQSDWTIDLEQPTQLWRYFLLLTGIFLLTEMFIIRIWN